MESHQSMEPDPNNTGEPLWGPGSRAATKAAPVPGPKHHIPTAFEEVIGRRLCPPHGWGFEIKGSDKGNIIVPELPSKIGTMRRDEGGQSFIDFSEVVRFSPASFTEEGNLREEVREVIEGFGLSFEPSGGETGRNIRLKRTMRATWWESHDTPRTMDFDQVLIWLGRDVSAFIHCVQALRHQGLLEVKA